MTFELHITFNQQSEGPVFPSIQYPVYHYLLFFLLIVAFAIYSLILRL